MNPASYTPPGCHLEQHRLRTGGNWIGNRGSSPDRRAASSRNPNVCSSDPWRKPSAPRSGVKWHPLPLPLTPTGLDKIKNLYSAETTDTEDSGTRGRPDWERLTRKAAQDGV